jgi:hypothetical protein
MYFPFRVSDEKAERNNILNMYTAVVKTYTKLIR